MYVIKKEDGIFELRKSQSSNITRILYFFIKGDIVMLTNGFVKKKMFIPRGEIKLVNKLGIIQADLSRIENGNGNPSIRTLKRIAAALGCKLEISFVRKE